jgi:hypothetical protein
MIVSQGGLLPASVIAYSTCFVLTMLFLRNKTKILDRVMIGLATTLSGVSLYEIAWHYSWGLGGLLNDVSALRLGFGGDAFPTYLAAFLAMLPLLVRQYITLNVLFLLILAISGILFAIWLSVGFPQFWCVCASKPILGSLLPNTWVKPDGWLNSDSVEPLGYVMNSLTKLLAVVPAFLFYSGQRQTS